MVPQFLKRLFFISDRIIISDPEYVNVYQSSVQFLLKLDSAEKPKMSKI